jgi:hypothetical protein
MPNRHDRESAACQFELGKAKLKACSLLAAVLRI